MRNSLFTISTLRLLKPFAAVKPVATLKCKKSKDKQNLEFNIISFTDLAI